MGEFDVLLEGEAWTRQDDRRCCLKPRTPSTGGTLKPNYANSEPPHSVSGKGGEMLDEEDNDVLDVEERLDAIQDLPPKKKMDELRKANPPTPHTLNLEA